MPCPHFHPSFSLYDARMLLASTLPPSPSYRRCPPHLGPNMASCFGRTALLMGASPSSASLHAERASLKSLILQPTTLLVQTCEALHSCRGLVVAKHANSSNAKHVPEQTQSRLKAPVMESTNCFPASSSSVERSTEEAHSAASFAAEAVVALSVGRSLPITSAPGFTFAFIVAIMMAIGVFAKPRDHPKGSVSDLVKRGQLRSDSRTKFKPWQYDDPFNNPLVNMGEKNPIVRICGKLFRLQPVTLTSEKVISHQNRRIQAYQWKRPIAFLNEGDPIPDGVDPEEVRWIPANHPFATTNNYIDENLAQQNVYQTQGVPSRVRAEHEALQRKMKEATKNWMARKEPAAYTCAKSVDKVGEVSCHTDLSNPSDEFQKCVNGRIGKKRISPNELDQGH